MNFSSANNARPKNIAEGKYATQSSTAHGGLASRITDGNAATNWHGGSCQHTQHETNPWVRVDLGGAAIVNHVSVDTKESRFLIYQSNLIDQSCSLLGQLCTNSSILSLLLGAIHILITCLDERSF